MIHPEAINGAVEKPNSSLVGKNLVMYLEEDDISITDSGFEVLTPNVPRTIEEVEHTVQG